MALQHTFSYALEHAGYMPAQSISSSNRSPAQEEHGYSSSRGVAGAASPLGEPFVFCLRSRTAAARSSRTVTVLSQSMHASVMLTPFLSADGPSAGTFWVPSLMFDSIMTPMMAFSPSRS